MSLTKKNIKGIVAQKREEFASYCAERGVDGTDVTAVEAAREAFARELLGIQESAATGRSYEARTVNLLAVGTDKEGRRLAFRTASGVPYRSRDIHADALRLAASAAGLSAVSVFLTEDCE